MAHLIWARSTNFIKVKKLENIGRRVTASANQLVNSRSYSILNSDHYHVLEELQKGFQRAELQTPGWSLAMLAPSELINSRRRFGALAKIPDELLKNIPENTNSYSLYQGYQATVTEQLLELQRAKKRLNGKAQKLLPGSGGESPLADLKENEDELRHRIEMMSIRKKVCSSEVREIDSRISALQYKRRVALDQMAALEQDELGLEHELQEVCDKIEDVMEEEDASTLAGPMTPSTTADAATNDGSPEFMSASMYEKLPSPSKRHPRPMRRLSMPILHEHLEAGSKIKQFQAHTDTITAMGFDAPFGTGVTAAMDDTVRVWDLNAARCLGLLEGHLSSVRCLQVEDNLVATGSMDATIKLWDLDNAQYPTPAPSQLEDESEQSLDESDGPDKFEAPAMQMTNGTSNCLQYTLESHVAEVTALHFRGNTLVSGSADKTLRQWDLVRGRCVQTLDVLWAAAQVSSSSIDVNKPSWQSNTRAHDATANFVGALQCFDAALACGTADGMVRLWDLRSGQVHRSLVGHTGPVSCLQFDDVHLVTGSLDRSIRVCYFLYKEITAIPILWMNRC